jgi:hypothetical protein
MKKTTVLGIMVLAGFGLVTLALMAGVLHRSAIVIAFGGGVLTGIGLRVFSERP